MLNKVVFILAYLCVSIILNYLANAIGSDFIIKFPGADLITLIVTIFAINVATSNFIVSKIQELQRIKNVSFERSYAALKRSMLEQVGLIVVTFVLLIIRESKVLVEYFDAAKFQYMIGIMTTFVLLYSIGILWDTGRSMFLMTKTGA